MAVSENQTAQFRDLSRPAALALLFLLIVLFHWKLVLTGQYTWLGSDDIARQVLPWFQFQASEWHAGRVPLWDPNHWAGQPVFGQAITGAASPLNWVLFALPLKHGWIKAIHLHWYFVVIHLLAAWFAYALCRDLRCSRWASVFGGFAYSVAGWMGQTDWPVMLQGAMWAPLVFLYQFRALRGAGLWRPAFFSGFFLGMGWLSGHHQIPIFVSLTCGFLWLWGARQRPALLGAGLLNYCAALCTGALQILPALEYGKLAVRWVGTPEPLTWQERVPYSIHELYSLRPSSLTSILVPGSGQSPEPFLGVALFAAAVAGAVACWRRRSEARLLVFVSLFGLILALGSHTPIHGILYSVLPLVEKARTPLMAHVLFSLGAAILGAMGVDALLSKDAGRLRRWSAVAAAAFGLVLGAGQFWTLAARGKPLDPLSADPRIVYAAFCSLLLAAALAGLRHGRPWALAGAWIGIMGMQIANDSELFVFHLSLKERMSQITIYRENDDIAAFLEDSLRGGRFEADDEAISGNFGDMFDLHQSDGYLASVTVNWRALESHHPHVKRLLGVSHFISRKPSEFHSRLVFKGKSGLNVYEGAAVLPRVFAVHEAGSIPHPNQAAFRNHEIRDRIGERTVVPGDAPSLEKCTESDGVALGHYDPARVRITASMACRGMVVLTDTWFPGWVATVDGREARIYEAYGALRGVVVDKGSHMIEYRYRPRSVFAGAALSGVAAAAAAALAFAGRKRRLAHALV
jgi:hypothetical protein